MSSGIWAIGFQAFSGFVATSGKCCKEFGRATLSQGELYIYMYSLQCSSVLEEYYYNCTCI